jgi:P pilus assembly chaperone PapD
LSLPIFVQPRQGPAKATLVWNLELKGDDTLNLRLDNKGTGHIQVSEIALFQPNQEQPVASQSSLVYVLPGQSRAWELKTQTVRLKPTDKLRLKVTTDAGSVDTDIDLGSR